MEPGKKLKKRNKNSQEFTEQYKTCVFMARVFGFVVNASFETESPLYKKVDSVVKACDCDEITRGFIGPQTPSRIITVLSKSKYINQPVVRKICLQGVLFFKGFYTKKPHEAYQKMCRYFSEVNFSLEEIEYINKVEAEDNYSHDELGKKAWELLQSTT